MNTTQPQVYTDDDVIEQLPSGHLYFYFAKRLVEGSDGVGGDWTVGEIQKLMEHVVDNSLCTCGIAKDPDHPYCVACTSYYDEAD